MAIKVGGTEVVSNARELKNIATVDSTTVSTLNTALNVDPTKGTLTKTFTQNETAEITLSSNVTVGPVVSATKEVPQTGISSKGAWDVNSTASNYDFHNTAANVTLTPSSALTGGPTSNVKDTYFSSAGYLPSGDYYIWLSPDSANESDTLRRPSQHSYSTPTGFSNWVNETTGSLYAVGSGTISNLQWTASNTYQSAYYTETKNSGKWYFEIVSSNQDNMPGVVLTGHPNTWATAGHAGAAIYSGAVYYHDGTSGGNSGQGISTSTPRVLGVAVDLDANKVWLSANNVWYPQEPSYSLTNIVALGSGSFAASDVGKRIVGNGGDVVLTSTGGAFSTTGGSAFTDSSTIAAGSWSMFGLKSAGDADGITMAGLTNLYSLNTGSNDATQVLVQNGDYRDLFISPNGQYMFAINTSNTLRRWTLSTPHDITTAGTNDQSYDCGNMSGIQSASQAITFSTNGEQFFALDNNGNLCRTYFSTAWDITTANNQTAGTMSNNYGTNYALAVSSDGLTFFASSGNGYIHSKSVSSAYNPQSSQTLSRSFRKGTEGDGVNTSRIEGLTLSSDGKKAFIVIHGSYMLRYDMTTAYDLATMSYANELLNISSQTDYPTGVALVGSTEGAKIAMLSRSLGGASRQDVVQYNIGSITQPTAQYHVGVTNTSGRIDSSAFTDINSMTAAQSAGTGTAHYAVSTDGRTTWNVAKGTDGVRPIVRNNSGTWQYNNDGGTTSNYQVANASYVQNKAIGAASIYGLFMKPDGTRLYYMKYSGHLHQWNLGTPYDISTATFATNVSSPFSGLSNYGTGLYFKSDGTYMYITSIGNNVVTRFTLSTAWDISTLGSAQNMSPNATAVPSNLQDLDFKTDGTVMYLVTNSKVHAYNLSTAWDLSTVSSTTPDATFTLTNLGSSGQAIRFKSDGTEFYVLDSSGSNIIIYSLSTAWDLSTASYSSMFSNSQSITTGRGLALSSDGMKMYIVDEASSARTYEYTIGSSAYATTATWANGTVNDELYTLKEALGAQSHNRMDKTQLDAVPDANHFSTGTSLDLMIALRMDTAAATLPTSDGVTLNYDAASLNEGAVLGTDYDFFHPAANKVQIKSLAAQNLKVRVV